MQKELGVNYFVLCCDLNFQVSANLDGITWSVVWWADSGGRVEEREDLFVSLLTLFGMKVDHSFHDDINSSGCYTRVPWGSDFEALIDRLTMIDFVCSSSSIVCSRIRIPETRFLQSDHLPVLASLFLPSMKVYIANMSTSPSLFGWRFNNDNKRDLYVNSVYEHAF